MNSEELLSNIKYLVNKYAPTEQHLIEIIKQKPDAAKGVLYDLSVAKQRAYDSDDIEIIKEISFYWV